jgi:hypothetical protein
MRRLPAMSQLLTTIARLPRLPAAAVLAALACCALAWSPRMQAVEDPALVLPPIRSLGEKMSIDSLPQVVQSAIRREGGPDISVAYKRTDATGSTVYSTHIKDAIGIHEMLTVSDEGEVISRYQERKRDNTRGLDGDVTTEASTLLPPADGGIADAPSGDVPSSQATAPSEPQAGSLAGAVHSHR